MRKLRILIALASIALASNLSNAAPLARYYPYNGIFEISNDSGGALVHATVQSPSGRDLLVNGGSFLQFIPGATKDDSEFPFAFTYLSLPPGLHNAGFVATPWLERFRSDLIFEYRTTSFTAPLIRGTVEFFFPEPTAAAMAGVGLAGLVGLARRRKAWR